MKRQEEVNSCISLIEDETVDHIHIRKKAIVSDFIDELQREMENDSITVVSSDVAEWDTDEIMETIGWDLQKELSTVKYYFSRIKSLNWGFPIMIE